MPPTLRKRKAPEPAPAAAAAPPPKKAAAAPKKTAAAPKKAAAPNKPAVAPAPKKKEAAAAAAAPKKETTTTAAAAAAAAAAPKKEAVEAEAEAETEAKDAPAPAPATAKAASKQLAVGDTVQLDDFGGEIETNDGVKTTLKKLVDESKSGVVLFTYPKASTPGCTKQVCFFRDAYKPLTADSGLAIYGLSADSPKANTAFRKNQKLPYPLLCDPDATLIAAIGLRKNPRGTQRGVFVVDKHGKVLVAEAGSPQGTFDRVKALVEELKE